jgi:hypothetical protein
LKKVCTICDIPNSKNILDEKFFEVKSILNEVCLNIDEAYVNEAANGGIGILIEDKDTVKEDKCLQVEIWVHPFNSIFPSFNCYSKKIETVCELLDAKFEKCSCSEIYRNICEPNEKQEAI